MSFSADTRIVFVYSGLGSSWSEMTADLLKSDSVFAERFSEVDRVLKKAIDISVLELAGRKSQSLAPGEEHAFNFAYQISMTARLREWGIRPDFVAGHSAGEVAAAVDSNVLTLDQAALVIGAHRAVLDGWERRCGLAFVAMPPDKARTFTGDPGDDVVAAAINDPGSAVFSGPPEKLDLLVERITAAGFFARRLPLFSPLHHPWLAPRLDAMRSSLAGLRPNEPTIPFLSSWRGGQSQPGDFAAEYWVAHVSQVNRFGDAILSLQPGKYFALEIAPHPILGESLRATFRAGGFTGSTAATGKRNQPALDSLRALLWELRHNDIHLDWSSLAPRMGATPANKAVTEQPVDTSWRGDKSPARLAQFVVSLVAELVDNASPELNEDSGFLESGLDSMGLVALKEQLRARLGVEVGAEVFFGCPTPRRLAEKILGLDSPSPIPIAAQGMAPDDGVAVVGMACRLPGGVDSPDAYWQLLLRGEDAIVPVPPDRWDSDAWYDADPHKPGKTHTRSGGFLTDPVDGFDAEFFGMSAAEADALDPQQRLFLETAWEAFESAGIDPTSLKGARVGVFLGLSADDYAIVHRYSDPRLLGGYSLTGSTGSTACGRVSFFFGLEGPSYVVDTACSSSLACLHLARRALLNGEVDMALAGGANIMLIPEIHVCFSKLGATSADGRCKTFDVGANGYGRGEGAGMVVVKRLADAYRDDDPVLAVVRGSSVNSDGRSSSLTAPNGRAQEAVERQALAQTGWRPEEVGYVETHGTGTPLGDAVEATALGEVYGVPRRQGMPLLRIGSAKPMIGHLEAAAGVASFIKVALAVNKGVIPASIGCETPNPEIAWKALNMEVNRHASQWLEKRRRAGISAFGIGGTNCHALIENVIEPETKQNRTDENTPDILLLSARTPDALKAMCDRWSKALRREDAPSLADACHTARAGRARFRRRVAATGKDKQAMAEVLSRLAVSDETGKETAPTVSPEVVFLYPGQGAQRTGMGRALYESQPIYRDAFDKAALAFVDALPIPLGEALFGAASTAKLLSGHVYAQASMFAAGVAATALWRSWGVDPSAVMGHSVGEYAAAWAAGALRLEDAAALVAERAKAMDRLPPGGGMAAVRLDAEEALASFARTGFTSLEVAAANAPGSTTVSGPVDALLAWGEAMKATGIAVTPLAVSGAFHSVAVEPVLDRLLTVGREIRYNELESDWWSTRRVASMKGSDLATYWAEQTRGGVRFMDTIRALRDTGKTIFIEMGPGTTLCGLGRASCPDALFLPGMGAAGLELETALRSLGTLWERGVNPDPTGLNPDGRARRVSMPTYPFQRRRHWNAAPRIFPGAAAMASTASLPHQPYLGSVLDGPGVEGMVWESIYTDVFPDFMPEHVILGRAIAPAAAYISLAISAGIERWGTRQPLELSDFEFSEALIGTAEQPRLVRVILDAKGGFTVASRAAAEPGDAWIRHATGMVRILEKAEKQGIAPPLLSGEGVIEEGHDEIYSVFLGNDYALGESFRHIQTALIGENFADCRVDCRPPQGLAGLPVIHPGVMDSIIQTGMPAMGSQREDYLVDQQILIPMRVDRLVIWKLPEADTRCLCSLRHSEGATVNNIEVFANTGEQIMRVEGMILRRANQKSLFRNVRRRPGLYSTEWQTADLPTRVLGMGWIVAADSMKEAETFAAMLREAGMENIRAVDAQAGRTALAAVLTSHPSRQSDDGQEWRFVYAAADGGTDMDAAERIIGGVYNFTQALADTGILERGRLWLVKKNGDNSLWQGALAGFGRSFRQEHQSSWGGFSSVDAWNSPALATLLSAAPLKEDEWQVDATGVCRVPRVKPLSPPSTQEASTNARRTAARIRGGTHWITGGVGALGQAVAGWLLARGAARIILSGRREIEAGIETVLDDLRKQAEEGCTVEYQRCDVVDIEAVKRLVDRLADGPSLVGVYHAAGVLEDGALTEKTWESVRAALAAKALGAYNLHMATQGLALENFILFSSAASLLGSPGQTAYSSANAALDSLARHRHACGLPALAVQWGPWAKGGMATAPGRGDRLSRLGMDSVNPEDALFGLEQLLPRDLPVASIMHMDWSSYFKQWLGGRIPGRFELVAPDNETPEVDRATLTDLMTEVAPEKRRETIETWLDEAAGRLLGRHERLDPEAPLLEQGFDSLMAIEWRECMAKALDRTIPSSFLFDYPTLRLVADFILAEVFTTGKEPVNTTPVTTSASADTRGLLDELDNLLGE
jgi:acyl transferase domain-containing protein